MTREFKKDPLGHIYEELGTIEAQVLAEEQALIAARTANAATLARVRALQDTIRPTVAFE